MAKKKSKANKKFNTYMGIALLVFIVVTYVMAFLPNVVYTATLVNPEAVSGFNAILGWSSAVSSSITITYATFSFGAMVAYLLPVLGLITIFMFKDSKWLSLVPFACFVASAVMLFLIPNLIVYTSDAGSLYLARTISLGYGAIVAGIMSCLSALVVLFKVYSLFAKR